MKTLSALLDYLKTHDVVLLVKEGKIKYQDPNNVLAGEVLESLKHHKATIIELFKEGGNSTLEIASFDRSEGIPVSSGQRQLLFSEGLAENTALYNLPLALLIKTPLNPEWLMSSLTQLLQRHESLRLGFKQVDGEWQAKLNPVDAVDIHYEENNVLSDELVSARVEQEVGHHFSFDFSPLTRIRCVRYHGGEHLVVILMHHAVMDGFSVALLQDELTRIYSAHAQGKETELPALNCQYLDYVNWLNQQSFAEEKAYWIKALDGANAVFDLAHDYSRPAVMEFSGQTLAFDIDKTLTSQLDALSQQQGVTPFTTILTAFYALLYRYTGQQDILVGVPFANRNLPQTTDLIGLLANTLPIRGECSSDLTFIELLKQVSNTLSGAKAHQNLSFEKIVDIVNPERSASYSPLFQVIFNYIEAAQVDTDSSNNETNELGDCEQIQQASSIAKYDLFFNVANVGETLKVFIEYSTALYKDDTITRLFQHFTMLLKGVVKSPELSLKDYDFFTPSESRMLNAINSNKISFNPNHNPQAWVEQFAEQTPDRIALVFKDREVSFAELTTMIDRCAHALTQSAAYSPDKPIRAGIFMVRSIEMVVSIFALWKIGGAYVPLDPAYPTERIKGICDSAELDLMLTQSFLLDFAPKMADITTLNLDELCQTNVTEATGVTAIATKTIEHDHLAYLIYTSGSTGKPKGVMLSYGNLNNLLASLDAYFSERTSPSEDDDYQCWLAQTSISFDISIVELIWTLTRGHKVVLQQSRPPTELLYPVASSSQKKTPDNLLQSQTSETEKAAVKPLEFSIMYFAADVDVPNVNKYELLIEGARYADQNDFSAVWMPERHFNQFGGAYPNPSVTAAALSTVTSAVQLRAGSVVLPLHDPIRVAEEWAVVDNLSNGRVGLAVASGWHHNDFVFACSDFENRHQRLRENIEELRELWSGKAVNRTSGIGKDIEISVKPAPYQAELPLWITAAGNPQTFQYAGQIGAGILTHFLGQSIEQLQENISLYHATLKAHGHDLAKAKVTLMLHTYLGEQEEAALATVKAPFKAYLESSIQLLKPLAEEQNIDLEGDREAVLEFGFNRFKHTNALFGTPDSCQDLLHSLQQIGVTEIASLIDFGIDNKDVLEGLTYLTTAKEQHEKTVALGNAFSPDEYQTEIELIKQHNISHVQLTPSQLQLILQEWEYSGDSMPVQSWLVGGEALSHNILSRLSDISSGKIYNMYGPTETTVWSAISEADTHIGLPIGNTQFLVVDSHGSKLPPGLVGELYIGGAGVSLGYWNNPELTEAKFIHGKNAWGIDSTLFDSPLYDTTFYRTGDLVRMLDDGRLEFLGRIDKQVKISGHRIELGEIESVLLDYPGVRDASAQIIKGDGSHPASINAYVVADGQDSNEHNANNEKDHYPQPVKYQFPNGVDIFDTSDRHLGALYQEIFEQNMYLKEGITLEDNACILDVGGNIGSFSIFAQHHCKQPTIYAFEPIPQTFALLKRNFEHHHIQGQVFNLGISNKNEQVEFSYYPNMPGLSGRFADIESEVFAAKSMIRGAVEDNLEASFDIEDPSVNKFIEQTYQSEQVKCQLTTISDVIAQKNIQQVDLLKVDIEKSECLALEGIKAEDWPKIQQITMEIDGDENLQIIQTLLEQHNFNVAVLDFINVAESKEQEAFNVYMLYAKRENIKRPIIPAPNDTKTTSRSVSSSDIRYYLSQHLPDYMLPRDIYLLSEFPKLPNGKLDVNTLTALNNEAPQKEVIAPSTKTEIAICDIWKEVLKKEQVGLNSNFFELGGTSFDLVNLHVALQKSFSLDISIIELFRYVTVTAQTDLVENTLKNQGQNQDGEKTKQAIDRGASRRKRIAAKRKKELQ